MQVARKPASRRIAAALIATIAMLVAFAAGAAPPAARPATEAPRISVLEIDGVINPLTVRYVQRALRDRDVDLVVAELDTPGGLMSSMHELTQAILASPVPVVVWVAPPGARAASAGMFVTLAAHVAAMAPGTTIGAAHPVAVGARAASTELAKVTADAGALARALAQAHGRNAAWAERAVRDSVALSADEAVRQGVVDLLAPDLPTLLSRLDGRRVATTAGEVVLRTADARVERTTMTLPERLLHAITDPSVAYLLFGLGVLGLIAELYSPGLLLPGVVGAIALALALVGFDSLPITWAGLGLLGLAFALFVAELFAAGGGVLGVGGLVAFVAGSLLLYQRGGPDAVTLPALQVDPWLIGIVAALLAGPLGGVLRAVVRARREPVATGIEALVGSEGAATSELAPDGTVRLAGEEWRARAVDAPIHLGDPITVVDVEGVTLWVTRRPALAGSSS